MKIETKFDYNQRVYADGRDKVVSGIVKTVKSKCDRFGVEISYDVWIDRDDKLSYEYWMSGNESFFYGTYAEAEKAMLENKALRNGKGGK